MKGLLIDTSTQARRQKAHTIARLFYRLQSPHWDSSYVTQYGNPIWINKVTKQAVILYDEMEEIPLRTHNADGTYWGRASVHVTDFLNERYPNATTEQKAFVRDWIRTHDTCTIDQLILENGGTSVNLPGLPDWASVIDPSTIGIPAYDDNGAELDVVGNWERSV